MVRAVALGVLGIVGCNGATEVETEKVLVAATDPDAQPDIFDEDGSRYVWQRKLPSDRPLVERALGAADAELQHRYKPIAEMSVEELAAKLRPRRFRNGHEYLLDHDPIDLAIKAKAGAFPPTQGANPSHYPVDLGNRSPASARGPLRERLPENPAFIIGSDDRVSYDQAPISWPAMTNLLVEGRHCTATTIGPRTAVSAAHCFFDGTNYNTSTGYYLRYASTSSYSMPIPDLSTVYSTFRVSDCAGVTASASSTVILSIHHSWVRDLKVSLVSPSNKTYLIHNRTGGWLGANDFLWGVYTFNLTGEPVSGRWQLMITDAAGQDVGTLDYWQLSLGLPSYCTQAAYRGLNVPQWTGAALDIDLPSGWDGADWQFDFARVTFPFGTFSQWGWVGTSIAPPGSDRNGQTANMWGYPDHRPDWLPVGMPQADPSWVYPKLLLKTGMISDYMLFATSLSPRSAYIHTLDIFSGDSGAGLLDLNGNLMGIQSTQWNVAPSGLSILWNEARAWDATTAAFFSAGGSWP